MGLTMENTMYQSEQINELATALSKAQGAMRHATKDVKNEFFKSKYADLASVMDAARAPLADNGLSIVQVTDIQEKGTVLVTQLTHSSGQWVRSWYPITPVKNDPQGFGSAMTYARRYSYSAIVGIASEDDDGNAASGNLEKPKSVFKNAAGRNKFCDDLKSSFEKADSLAALSQIYAANEKRIEDMKASGDEMDTLGVEAIRQHYKLASTRLKRIKHRAGSEADIKAIQGYQDDGWITEDPIDEPASIAATDIPAEAINPERAAAGAFYAKARAQKA